ncbi:MAG TPA: hypothetical protein VNN07_15155 [Candidatus Tectomicrobia bacterium]|nr:hypothetical protein [Candidatus Tectomicrobia bacterium]
MPGEGFFSVDSLRGVWVLLIDPDAGGRRALADVLGYCGALVTAVGTPDEAFRIMRQVKPDVLVVDLAISQPEPFAFIRQVRSLKPEDGGVVPAIAIGAGDGAPPEDVVRGRGYDGHLRKPLDPWTLCGMVSRVTSGR